MFKRFLKIVITILIVKQSVYGQITSKNIFPPSPRASAFHIYGDYPVSYSKGLANISIPLYTIEVGGRKFPITLRYHHSGIKFYQTEESNVATGWQIDYGGLISVSRMGKRDQDYAHWDQPLNNFSEMLEVDFNALERIYNELHLSSELDGQYDFYNYDFNGNSGKFIYDKNGKVIKFPYNNLDFKLGFTANNTLSYFDAFDVDGLHFRFGKGLYDNIVATESGGGGSCSFLLTDVETPEGAKMKYIYANSTGGFRMTPAHYAFVKDSRWLSTTDPAYYPQTDPTAVGVIQQYSMNTYSTKIIKEITFPNGKIVFTSDAEGLRISKIDVYNSEGIIKRIVFNTTDFENLQKRYSLNSLEFRDLNDNVESVYHFEYDPGRFPTTQHTNALDYWGYYNHQFTNAGLVPNFSIQFNQSQRTLYPVGQNCNRNVSEAYMQAYILKKIIYPTGGSSEFIYEANRYGTSNNLGGGLRIKQIINDDGKGEKNYKTYKYGTGILELVPTNPDYYVRGGSRNWEQYPSAVVPPHPSYIFEASYRTRYYGSEMNGNLTFGGGNQISYREVTEYQGTETNNIGRTIYKYDYFSNGYTGYGQDQISYYYLSTYSNWKSGNLIEKIIEKKKDDGTWELVSRIVNDYTFTSKDIVTGVVIEKKLELPTSYYQPFQQSPPYGPPAHPLYNGNYIYFLPFTNFRDNILNVVIDKRLFNFFSYDIPTGYAKLNFTTEILKTAAGDLTTRVDFEYGIPDFLKPTKEITINSKGYIVEKRKKYVFSDTYLNLSPYTSMIGKNILYNVLEEKQYMIKDNIETLLQTNKVSFKQFYPNVIKPEISEMYYGTNSAQNYITNTKYDMNGNLIMKWNENDVKEVYLWGYGGTYPIAKIVNADYATVSMFVNMAILNDINSTEAQISSQLNSLRIGLAGTNAMITTYIYKPLVGVTSETDINGKSIYYSYDNFNRLKYIKDTDGKILKKYEYEYLMPH